MYITIAFNPKTFQTIHSNTFNSQSAVQEWINTTFSKEEQQNWLPLPISVQDNAWRIVQSAIEIGAENQRMAILAQSKGDSDLVLLRENRERALAEQREKLTVQEVKTIPMTPTYRAALEVELTGIEDRITDFLAHVGNLRSTMHTENQGTVENKMRMYLEEVEGLVRRKAYVCAQLGVPMTGYGAEPDDFSTVPATSEGTPTEKPVPLAEKLAQAKAAGKNGSTA